MAYIQDSMLFKALDQGIGKIVGAAADMLETGVKAAPGAIGATMGAAGELVGGVNEAVRGFGESIAPQISAPAAAPNFASMCAGLDFSGLKSCSTQAPSMSPSLTPEHGLAGLGAGFGREQGGWAMSA